MTDPFVLVLHGGPGLTQEYLLPHLNKLKEFAQVVFYTQSHLPFEGLLEEIEKIRKYYNQEQMILLGHSWGGYLAMRYAMAYPERVEKLILANPLPPTSVGYHQFEEEKKRRTKQDLDPKSEDFYRLFFTTYLYDPKDVEKLNLKQIFPQDYFESLSNETVRKPYNLVPALNVLQFPTLVIHGDTDPIPAAAVESIPHTQFLLIEQCGHFPFVEKPDIFFEAIRGFLCF